MGDLIQLVLRSKAPGLRWRVTVALVLTLAGKALGVLAPLMLGKAVNQLSAGQGAAAAVTWAFAGLAAGWALIRFISAAAPQARDAVFTPVAQAAQNRAAVETFSHALSLSIDFHQSKRTGSLSRVIDRGARSMDFLLRGLVFNVAPTGVELIMAAIVLAKAYDWRFAAVALLTVAIYGYATFAISDWRIGHRRVLNDADAEAAGRAVDALLNYETVKSFGGEDRAVAGYGPGAGRLWRGAGQGDQLAEPAERRPVGGDEPGPGRHGRAGRRAGRFRTHRAWRRHRRHPDPDQSLCPVEHPGLRLSRDPPVADRHGGDAGTAPPDRRRRRRAGRQGPAALRRPAGRGGRLRARLVPPRRAVGGSRRTSP
jgi:hypothetical protein